MFNAGVPEERISQITGHSVRRANVLQRRYVKFTHLRVMKADLERLRYEGLDLSYLTSEFDTI